MLMRGGTHLRLPLSYRQTQCRLGEMIGREAEDMLMRGGIHLRLLQSHYCQKQYRRGETIGRQVEDRSTGCDSTAARTSAIGTPGESGEG